MKNVRLIAFIFLGLSRKQEKTIPTQLNVSETYWQGWKIQYPKEQNGEMERKQEPYPDCKIWIRTWQELATEISRICQSLWLYSEKKTLLYHNSNCSYLRTGIWKDNLQASPPPFFKETDRYFPPCCSQTWMQIEIIVNLFHSNFMGWGTYTFA